ncbi:hypothetical protein L210DRAFT_3164654 [Boletus edulis BED1]|uniref:Uncharacterized protein n=1 Tax=Boletus edulis BED1 TaxID=1328754 RepID=A0AAD4BY42_BOLED|nr:hypothetical protein L210DRAFT_3164654 [Boletus edulis BED1]
MLEQIQTTPIDPTVKRYHPFATSPQAPNMPSSLLYPGTHFPKVRHRRFPKIAFYIFGLSSCPLKQVPSGTSTHPFITGQTRGRWYGNHHMRGMLSSRPHRPICFRFSKQSKPLSQPRSYPITLDSLLSALASCIYVAPIHSRPPTAHGHQLQTRFDCNALVTDPPIVRSASGMNTKVLSLWHPQDLPICATPIHRTHARTHR